MPCRHNDSGSLDNEGRRKSSIYCTLLSEDRPHERRPARAARRRVEGIPVISPHAPLDSALHALFSRQPSAIRQEGHEGACESVASLPIVTTGQSELEMLKDDQRAWILHSEALWREAHAIAGMNPGLDPGDVYHAFRCLELPPAERLRRGLTRVRARSHLG